MRGSCSSSSSSARAAGSPAARSQRDAETRQTEGAQLCSCVFCRAAFVQFPLDFARAFIDSTFSSKQCVCVCVRARRAVWLTSTLQSNPHVCQLYFAAAEDVWNLLKHWSKRLLYIMSLPECCFPDIFKCAQQPLLQMLRQKLSIVIWRLLQLMLNWHPQPNAETARSAAGVVCWPSADFLARCCGKEVGGALWCWQLCWWKGSRDAL